jgi:hypothetical protein
MNKLLRTLGLSILAVSLSMGLAVWTVPAHAAAPAPPTTTNTSNPPCIVFVGPPSSIVESGLGPTASSFAATITVECKPIFSEQLVTIDATQLSNACHGTLSWLQPGYPGPTPGAQFTVYLDNDGNANAVVWGGPSCAASTDLITASLNTAPFSTARTHITILPPQNTPSGVTANPSSEVEDATYSAIATVIRVEFPSVYAEKLVIIKSQELYARCGGLLIWFGPDELPPAGGGGAIAVTGAEATVQLDNNGNAFVVVVGPFSCASGTSTVTADLVGAPYTTKTTHFTILSPRPTHT